MKSNLIGKRFGRLTVIEKSDIKKRQLYCWVCKCDCGNFKIVDTSSLTNGHTKSCGCMHGEYLADLKRTHGESKTRLYKEWQDIKARCHNPNNKFYHIYGGKGVRVCDEWKESYESFRDWAIATGYNDNLTIDRIDVDGNYEPTNCRWVDLYVQANNRSNTHYVTYHGETDSLDNMCRKLNVSSKAIRQRMRRRNFTFEQAVDNYEHTSPFKEYWKN